MTGCAICGKGPADGVNIYRVKEKGVPGVYACKDHMHNFDAKVDPEVFEISEILGGKREKPR